MPWLKSLLANILKSKTLWINGLGVLVQLLTYATGITPPSWQPWLVVALAIINIMLRFVTDSPIVPGPTPTPDVPAPKLPDALLWLLDILKAIANKQGPPAELKALAVKIVEGELATAEAEAVK